MNATAEKVLPPHSHQSNLRQGRTSGQKLIQKIPKEGELVREKCCCMESRPRPFRAVNLTKSLRIVLGKITLKPMQLLKHECWCVSFSSSMKINPVSTSWTNWSWTIFSFRGYHCSPVWHVSRNDQDKQLPQILPVDPGARPGTALQSNAPNLYLGFC